MTNAVSQRTPSIMTIGDFFIAKARDGQGFNYDKPAEGMVELRVYNDSSTYVYHVDAEYAEWAQAQLDLIFAGNEE